MSEAPDPLTLAANAQIEAALGALPPWHTLEPADLRRRLREGMLGERIQLDIAQTRTIPGPAGPIPIRVFIPDDVRGVFLHFHGGGWVIGDEAMQDANLWARAQAAHTAVVSVGYRLAPEDPYPAAPDDCEAAARWLIEHAAAEFGTERLVVGGESSGAHLSVVTLLRLRDRHGYTGVRGVALGYGFYDLRLTPSARLWGERPLVQTTPLLRWFAELFAADAACDDPDVSPLLAPLHDLPPAHFTVGDQDPLLDDTLFMAARWRAAGNESALQVYPGACHGFDVFLDVPVARQAQAAIDTFISTRAGAGAGS